MTISRTPTLEEVLTTALDNRIAEIHTALPGKVESYDKVSQKANIKPLLQRTLILEDAEEITEPLPVINDVPIVFPRAGGFFISFPVKPGDHVTLIIMERSIDKFATGQGIDTDPVDIRTHDLSDAVAIPGFFPFQKSLTSAHGENMVLGRDLGLQIHIKPVGEIHLGSENAAAFVARIGDKTAADTSMATWMSQVAAAINILAPGSVTPVTPTDFGVISTGSSKVKAD